MPCFGLMVNFGGSSLKATVRAEVQSSHVACAADCGSMHFGENKSSGLH